MCGFLGELSFTKTLTSQAGFEELLALSKHRGPDNSEILTQKNYQLGFNRLAILDLSVNGNQPKLSPTGKYHLVFNGEVYNFKELQEKHQLKNLKSTSDTEVLLYLLDKIGVLETLKSLNGMFAIAVVEVENNTLYLARDFAGIKPLFFGENEKGIVFASQFNQVFKHSWFKDNLKLRSEIIKEYFGFGYMQAPNTVYQNIFQVNPGELIKVSKKGNITKEYFCSFSKEMLNKRIKAKPDDNYLTVLKKSVNNQLVSDVPIASFLSGGIDSPLITAVAKQIKPDIHAFTFGINHPKYDETQKATEYASHLKVQHTVKKSSEKDLLAEIENHFKYIPEPFGDYSSIPTYVITKQAKKRYTVILSGDGGDELFFGYPRMLDVLNKKLWFSIPFSIRKPIIRILNKTHLINTWAPFYSKTMEEFVYSKQMKIIPNILDQIVENTTFSKEMKHLFKVPKSTTKKEWLHWLRWNEFYGHLQRVLIKVDRASMGNSLEVRVPFLDKVSIDYAWKNTTLELNNHTELKQELKNSLENYYPEKIIQKHKKGFSVPIEDWLRNDLKEDLEKCIFKTPFYGEELINIRIVKKFVSDFLEGKHNNGWGVWHIYAWQKWAYTHVF